MVSKTLVKATTALLLLGALVPFVPAAAAADYCQPGHAKVCIQQGWLCWDLPSASPGCVFVLPPRAGEYAKCWVRNVQSLTGPEWPPTSSFEDCVQQPA